MRSFEGTALPAEERGVRSGSKARAVGLLTLGHFINDVYPGFIPPLLPLFIDKFGLSLTLAGLLGTVLSLSASISQLSFGWLADRIGRRFFVVAGPLTGCVFLSVAPLAGSYAQLMVLVVLGGLGVAAFHPSGASLTGSHAGGRKNLAVSVFSAAGSVGFGTGPILILGVIMTFGLERSYLAMIPGLLTVGVLAVASPRWRGVERGKDTRRGSIGEHWKILMLLWFVAVVRAAVIMGFENFVPIMIKEHGGTLMSGGAAVSLFLLCGSLGGIAGGYLSDKVDPRKVLIFSSIAPVPLFIAFLKLGSPADLVSLGLAGAFAFAAVPVTIVMAQESVPGRTSTASSLVMGVAWGAGGTVSAGVGYLADVTGVSQALLVLALVSLVSAPCVPFLPGRKAKPRLVPVP